jgi:AcrR family transcriptional regulator
MSVARQTKREDRRDAILDVAQECFLADGYGLTSMSTIAARLGGSKGTLYNYFKSKEELFSAVIERSCARMQTLLALSAEGDVRECLLRLAQGIQEYLLSPEAIAINRIVVSEGQRFPELARLFYEAGPRQSMAGGGRIIRRLMDAGQLRKADPVVATQQFKDLALSGAFNLRLWGILDELSHAEREARAETAVDTFLRAYAP